MARFNSTFENAFVAWIKSVLGSSFVVLWDKQEVETPTTTYALLSYLTAGNIEDSTTNRVFNDDKSSTIITHETLTLSVNVYDNSSDYLNKISQLKRSFFDDIVLQTFHIAGLSCRNFSATQDLSELQETSYEFRAQSDFIFAYAVETTEKDTGYMTRVSGDILDTNFDVDINPIIGD
jgi:hypothetical protein